VLTTDELNKRTLKEAARSIREHNNIHRRKEPRAIYITQYLEFAADLIEKIADGKISFTKQRHGRWIPIEYNSYADGNPVWDKWECSECGHEHNGEEDTLTAFCPDCGTYMREEGANNAESD
jgi:rubrerythrin